MPPVPPETDASSIISKTDSQPLPKQTFETLTEEYIQVDDKVYSTRVLAENHPGGELFVRAFAGRDATEAFLSYHRRQFPHNRLSDKALAGVKPPAKGADDNKDFLDLCKVIEKVIPRNKSFAPFSYYIKVLVIVSMCFVLEGYMHITGNYRWYLCAMLGFFMAQIGINIQHDANHGSISPYHWVNRFLGCGQNWIGASAVDWVHQHVVQHHIHTNEVHTDPDIHGTPILRLNPFKPLLSFQAGQHLYFFLLITIFGYFKVLSTIPSAIEGAHFTPYSKFLTPHRIFESFTGLVFLLRWFAYPLYVNPSVWTLVNIAPMFIVSGYYLAFFFILSHNFVGVHMFEDQSTDSDDKNLKSFLYRQVASSSNVGGAWLCFLNGGLNYQIEHHLFPRIQHSHYPKIAPYVREFCLKRGIPYVHFDTIQDNLKSCITHLNQMGSILQPVEINKRVVAATLASTQ